MKKRTLRDWFCGIVFLFSIIILFIGVAVGIVYSPMYYYAIVYPDVGGMLYTVFQKKIQNCWKRLEAWVNTWNH